MPHEQRDLGVTARSVSGGMDRVLDLGLVLGLTVSVSTSTARNRQPCKKRLVERGGGRPPTESAGEGPSTERLIVYGGGSAGSAGCDTGMKCRIGAPRST
jgi:hypothetical protein